MTKTVEEITEAKVEVEETEKLEEEAKALGIKIPKTSMGGLKSKKPEDIEKEKLRLAKDKIQWLQIMIAKAKAVSKMKPIDKRRKLLEGRFKAVRSRTRAHTYTNKNVEAWLEEHALIKNNPKSWNKITANGTKPFTPGNKKKKTAKDLLDEMDLEE